ncbi:hypothetical protein GCM10025734_07750 [Kitasatospora paranensis]|uniref:hypothetical protein n=1 Tax=Kitasatospora paranensis TaxID=258053 RepID=UPI0031E9D85A
MARIRDVLQANLAADLPRHHPVEVQRTLGYRVRELRATPDWEHGDWPALLALARQAMQRADDLRAAATWQPTDHDRFVAGRTGPKLERATAPAGPAGPGPSWLERASRLVRAGTALAATADALPSADDGRPGPLAEVLGATALACAALRTSAEEIERLWRTEPREPADPEIWERARVPHALQVQTEETGHVVTAVAVFLWLLACS